MGMTVEGETPFRGGIAALSWENDPGNRLTVEKPPKSGADLQVSSSGGLTPYGGSGPLHGPHSPRGQSRSMISFTL